MRWFHFIFLVLVAVVGIIVQTTVGQLLWFRTSVGWVGPELLAAVAVFMALRAHSRTDAALAGWVLGFAMDLTLSGQGFGLLALLYAAACWGIFRIREIFFRERLLTQTIMGFVFCVFVYELWTAYDVLVISGAGGRYSHLALQVLGLSAYTAILTPLACAVLKRMQGLLFPTPPLRQRR